MSNDLNQCQFIGRLAKEPDVRYMPNGKAATSFSIAVGSQWKSKDGAKQESVEWVNITAFDKLGEICGEYLRKGSQVFISGRMKTEKYQAKDGTDRYSTKIIAENMQMLGSKRDASDNDSPADRQPSGENRQQSAPVETYDKGLRQPAQGGAFANFDDDIPFADPYGRAGWRTAQ